MTLLPKSYLDVSEVARRRFPFPSLPRGWFAVAFSNEIPAGSVKTVHYFEQDIVLFRGESGVLSALDKTCPHLGAHLGGGRVQGDCLRCPFHEWAFNAQGACADVPYASKIPPKAKVRAWPLCERNGMVFVHYSPDGSAPTWEVPELPTEGWTADRVIRWEIDSHPQEVAENTVDCAHLKPIHDVIETNVTQVEQNEHVMRVVLRLLATGHVIEMPEEVNDVELDVTMHGVGHIISTTHVLNAGIRTRQRIYPTPIHRGRIAIFAAANTEVMTDAEYTNEIDAIFFEAFSLDFPRDFPIWENKVYLEKPVLAAGDGPIGRYRKWVRQFYVQPDAPQPSRASHDDVTERPSVLGRLTRNWGAWRSREGDNEPVAVVDASEVSGKRQLIEAQLKSGRKKFESVDAYFTKLDRLFNPSAAGDLDAVIQWSLTGEDGRDVFAEVKHGSIRIVPGSHAAPTVTVEMSARDYLLMINGELHGARAFSTGRGKLRGSVRLAMKMQQIFPLDRAD